MKRESKLMSKTDEKPHLSVSQLEMLSKCGEQYRQRHVLGRIAPPGVSALVGRGVDRSVDANLLYKIKTKNMLPEEAVTDLAGDAVKLEWRKGGVILTPEEKEEGVRKVKGAAVDKAVRLSAKHRMSHAPRINPISKDHIQKKFRIVVNGSPRDLIGYIDIQEKDAIRDTKTSAKTPNKLIVDSSVQLTAYALAVKVIDGKAPKKVALDYVVDLKRGPKATTLESKRTDQDFATLLRRMESALKALDKGVFIPASPDWWGCSPKYCGYYPCKYVSKRPESVSLVDLEI